MRTRGTLTAQPLLFTRTYPQDTRPVDTFFRHLVDNPKGFPCPPTLDSVLNGKRGAAVSKTLNSTWDLARQTNREEGGWIYMNRSGNFKAVQKDRNTMGGEGDHQTRIILGAPPRIRGWRVIGTFHTHDIDSDPSEPIPMGKDRLGRDTEIPGDTGTNASQRLPGIILGGTATTGTKAFTFYGPPRGVYVLRVTTWM